MISIKYKNLTAEIDTLGAQLRSLKKDGTELLWQGDNTWWEDTAPVLFPICSNLKNGVYKFEDKEYEMQSHGFAKSIEFEANTVADNSVILSAKSNDMTRKIYPFDFVFSVQFTLQDDKLVTNYIIKNTSEGDMYYSVGGHEGYDCPEGIENYKVVFNKTEKFESCVLDGPILTYNKDKILPDGTEIDLKPDYFTVDAIILEHINSDEVSLVNKTNGKKITVDVSDFTNLLIWTIPGAPFVCLEPWCGFPDFVDTDGDITKKHSIIKLPSGCQDIKTHSITF